MGQKNNPWSVTLNLVIAFVIPTTYLHLQMFFELLNEHTLVLSLVCFYFISWETKYAGGKLLNLSG